MTYGYSDDLRAAALSYYDRGGISQAAVSLIFCIGSKTLSNWLRLRKAGDFSRRPSQKPKGAVKLDETALRAHIASHPDAYMREMGAHFGVHPTTIHYACKRLGISRKKNRAVFGAQ